MKLGCYELGPNDTPENGIYCGDARELAKAIPDESVDWAYADPPYWVGYDYGNKTDADMDYIEPDWLVSELRRIAPTICLSVGITNLWRYPAAHWLMCWHKPGSTRNSNLGGFNIWEPILVYGKPAKRVWQDAIWLPDCANHTKDGAFHKCPKPERLLIWLIESFTNKGDIVFDPVAGSATTAKAAKMLGRQYLAFEIDPTTCELARERVRNTQPPLFVTQEEQLAMGV